MRNLVKAIKTYRELLALAGLNARQCQSILDEPLTPQYCNESGSLVVFYKVLSRYFLTGNTLFLTQAYAYYLSLEDEGWVISNGKLKNILFESTVGKIEAATDSWFYRYASDLNYEILIQSVEKIIENSLIMFRHYRKVENTQSITLQLFSAQVSRFMENRLRTLDDRNKEDYLKFLAWKLTLTEWDYRKTVYYNSMPLQSTEINIPVIEVELYSIISGRLNKLGIQWAQDYATEPTARNAFMKETGLFL